MLQQALKSGLIVVVLGIVVQDSNAFGRCGGCGWGGCGYGGYAYGGYGGYGGSNWGWSAGSTAFGSALVGAAAATQAAGEAELMDSMAAKNYQDVAVVVSPDDYPAILEELRAHDGTLSLDTKWRLAKKVFRTTADYDSAISARLDRLEAPGPLPADLAIRAPRLMSLRYGENPHQSAALYGRAGQGIAGAAQLQGKELSYNNLVDLDAAWQLACEFTSPAIAIIKHTNPCGCAEQPALVEAWHKALECDPVSAFGGVVGVNRPIDEETAREMAKLFLEAVAAPDYSPEALAIFGAKKNLRLMRVAPGADPVVIKSISGGFLAQTGLAAGPLPDPDVELAIMPSGLPLKPRNIRSSLPSSRATVIFSACSGVTSSVIGIVVSALVFDLESGGAMASTRKSSTTASPTERRVGGRSCWNFCVRMTSTRSPGKGPRKRVFGPLGPIR